MEFLLPVGDPEFDSTKEKRPNKEIVMVMIVNTKCHHVTFFFFFAIFPNALGMQWLPGTGRQAWEFVF